jgi:hypothetical protein
VTFEDELYEQLKNPTTFYVGFDPTADSLHIGHYIPIMAMAHMQRAGHKPIALMGGGTAMIGDPSGKTDMRKMMTTEVIDHNVECIKKQMSRFLDFSDDKAIIVNNGDWLRHLNFIEFMLDIGSMFSVNKMLTAECYKARMATENGLSFLEFTYMLMQSYDFLELFHRYGCRLEMGGNDQWSNMLGGADLVRRKEQEKAFACTFQLLLTHDGRKMGKTEAGALWLDENKTSPFNFYQYWRNVDDKDVEKCLALLTFSVIAVWAWWKFRFSIGLAELLTTHLLLLHLLQVHLFQLLHLVILLLGENSEETLVVGLFHIDRGATTSKAVGSHLLQFLIGRTLGLSSRFLTWLTLWATRLSEFVPHLLEVLAVIHINGDELGSLVSIQFQILSHLCC